MDIENIYNLFKILLPYAPQVLEPTNPLLTNMGEIQKVIDLIDSMGGVNNFVKIFNIQNKQKQENIDIQTTDSQSEIEKYPKIVDLE